MSYICEKCGKLVTEKYGSGRFCSRECANSRSHSIEVKNKIKATLNDGRFNKCYEGICICCGKKFTRSKIINGKISNRKTCSKECLLKLKSQKSLNNKGGGYREGSVKNYKYGTYKGINCDSSWELAYIVYNLEHGIKIKRNQKSFEYIFKDKKHLYYPDFISEDGNYIEIKNYWTEQVQAKIDQFPKELKYQILYYSDLKDMIKYCQEKYGKKYWERLYS